MKTYLELIILLPLLGGIVNALLGGRLLPRRASEFLACAVIWGSFAATVAAALAYKAQTSVEIATWLSDFDFKAPLTLYLDPLSLSLCLMITFVCALIHTYAVGYMKEDPSYVRFFALLNLFVAAMLLLVLAENLPLLYLGWEGVGFCSYALIGFWYTDPKNATAGRKAFIVTRIGDTGLGIAVVWLFELLGTESIPHLNQMGHLLPTGIVTALGLLLLLAAMGKSAQVPLMVWLPDAMAGPTPVSAQIHAATMVTAGVYLLMRMFPLIGTSPTVVAAIAITGAVTAFYGASCAVVQRDLKRILAYSTISQIGYMMMGVGAGAITASTFHLLVHAFFKALLFLGAGCVITAMHHEQDIFRMGGLRRTLPGTFWPFLAGALCLAGVPLTGGFFSKDGILGAVWLKGGMLYGGLYVAGLITALITAFYTFRMVLIVFGGEIPLNPPFIKGEVKTLPRIMEWPLIPLALLGLFGGLLNLPEYLGNGFLHSFLAQPGGNEQALPHTTELLLQGVAAVVAVTGIVAAWLRYGGERRVKSLAKEQQPASGIAAFLLEGWRLDALYDLLIVRPYTRLSSFLWQKLDEGVVDDSLDRTAALFGRCGRWIGSRGQGRVSLSLLGMAVGAALTLFWLAWVVL
ncbi:MAG: NADH-quinone oxidoreductase subunit L [Desulfuromonadaceae bacterium]|nr:NADH-quinone oxidoreductase subunit L [Desulfuromonadaceae bacterium]MDD2848902.1 NADH-quinone oxidoreductase subunit L [Desulfuromonadaceae bacterium]MDD4132141.1 NADH-quinone oxidoreductase subunit L [Desulfuromonadaceae bacterium]